MDNTSQWPRGIEQVEPRPISDQKRPRPQKEQVVHCPRCNSTNTKFCYYNNYSLSQPRYFCKACRRYWTEGGTLRNVPVGGGSRKNKRSSSSLSTQILPSSSKNLHDHATSASVSQCVPHQNPRTYEGHDLYLGYSPITTYDQYNKTMELLKNGSVPSIGLNAFMFSMPRPGSNPIFPSEYSLQEYKTEPNFFLNGINQNGFANFHNVQETIPRLFFPFEDLKQAPNPSNLEENKGQGEANGYWSGMLNEGSW